MLWPTISLGSGASKPRKERTRGCKEVIKLQRPRPPGCILIRVVEVQDVEEDSHRMFGCHRFGLGSMGSDRIADRSQQFHEGDGRGERPDHDDYGRGRRWLGW